MQQNTWTDAFTRRHTRWEGRAVTLTLFLLVAVTFIPFLGEALFNTKGEPREAVVAVSMLNQGNWILPVSFGADIPYKPPMLAWCIALLGWINGGVVTEFLSRLPSALSGVAVAMMTWTFLRRRTSEGVAIAATLVTAGAMEVFRSATVCRVDMLLTMFMVGAIMSLYRQWERRPGTWMPSLVAVLFMSGGVLTKGPVAMVLPCAIAFCFRLLRGDRLLPTLVSVGVAGALSLVLPAMWYVAAYSQGGEEFYRLAMEENFGRMTGTMSYASHEHNVLFYFWTLPAGFAPITLLLLMSLFAKPWRGCRWQIKSVKEAWERLRAMPALEQFCLLAAAIIFVFYCIPKSKRGVYILPMYPFTAFWIAKYLRYLINVLPRVVRAYAWVIATIGTLVSLLAVLVMWGSIPTFGGGSMRLTLEALRQMGSRFLPAFVTLVVLIAGADFMKQIRRAQPRVVLLLTLVYTLGVYCMLQSSVIPAAVNVKSDKPLAERVAQALPAGETLYGYRHGLMDRYYTIGFYLTDGLPRFDALRPERGVLLVGEEDFQTMVAEHGGGYTFTPIEATLGRSREAKKEMRLMKFERTPKPGN